MKLSYRDVFFAWNGLGPWKCKECGDLIWAMNLHIHHLDYDHSNNDPNNLVPLHETCHKRLHKLGRPLSPAHAAKARRAFLGRRHTVETKQRMREAELGKKRSEATKEKHRIAAKAMGADERSDRVRRGWKTRRENGSDRMVERRQRDARGRFA